MILLYCFYVVFFCVGGIRVGDWMVGVDNYRCSSNLLTKSDVDELLIERFSCGTSVDDVSKRWAQKSKKSTNHAPYDNNSGTATPGEDVDDAKVYEVMYSKDASPTERQHLKKGNDPDMIDGLDVLDENLTSVIGKLEML